MSDPVFFRRTDLLDRTRPNKVLFDGDSLHCCRRRRTLIAHQHAVLGHVQKVIVRTDLVGDAQDFELDPKHGILPRNKERSQ